MGGVVPAQSQKHAPRRNADARCARTENPAREHLGMAASESWKAARFLESWHIFTSVKRLELE
jgi:hypothetical protein